MPLWCLRKRKQLRSSRPCSTLIIWCTRGIQWMRVVLEQSGGEGVASFLSGLVMAKSCRYHHNLFLTPPPPPVYFLGTERGDERAMYAPNRHNSRLMLFDYFLFFLTQNAFSLWEDKRWVGWFQKSCCLFWTHFLLVRGKTNIHIII